MTEQSSSNESRWWDAARVAEAISSGEVSAVEMTEAAIERIEADEPQLNALSMRWFDHAREVAAAKPSGPFGGVPFLLKDLWIQYAGKGRTDGNVALTASPPVSTVDSVLTTRFKHAGLVTLGRSTSPEMGSIPATESAAHGATRNPWNTDYSPGGSSGGSSAAVAAGYVKTSQGRITMEGHGIETGLGVDGFLTRTVRDTARMLDAVHGPGVGDSVIAPAPARPYVDELEGDVRPLRIGILDVAPEGGSIDEDCRAAVRNTAAALEGLGHHVEHGHPPSLLDLSLIPRFLALWAAGRRAGIANMGRSALSPFDPAVVGRRLGSAAVTHDDRAAVPNWRARLDPRRSVQRHAARC